MSVVLAGIDPPLRMSWPEPMSVAEFWRVALENPDLRIEREPNGDVTLMSPAHRAASLYSTNVLGQLFVWT